MYGWYLNNVTRVQVSLTLTNGLFVFSVPCSNIIVTLIDPPPASPEYYSTLTCQLPQLSYDPLPYPYHVPSLQFQLNSPYGTATSNFGISLDATSSTNTAAVTNSVGHIVRAALSFGAALLSL